MEVISLDGSECELDEEDISTVNFFLEFFYFNGNFLFFILNLCS